MFWTVPLQMTLELYDNIMYVLKALYQDIRATCYYFWINRIMWETNWLFCTSQYPHDVDIASSLADRGYSGRQARASGVIVMSQKKKKKNNMQSMYTDVPIFLAQKNVTVSIFSRYMLIQCLWGTLCTLSLLTQSKEPLDCPMANKSNWLSCWRTVTIG